MLFCYYYAEFSVHVCWECLAITVPTITFLCCVARSFIIMLLIPNTHNSRNLKAACLYTVYIYAWTLYSCVFAALSLASRVFNKEVIFCIATRPWLSHIQFKEL